MKDLAAIHAQLHKWVDASADQLEDMEFCKNLLYDVDKQLRQSFTNELEIII
jgi:hypothetical protein